MIIFNFHGIPKGLNRRIRVVLRYYPNLNGSYSINGTSPIAENPASLVEMESLGA